MHLITVFVFNACFSTIIDVVLFVKGVFAPLVIRIFLYSAHGQVPRGSDMRGSTVCRFVVIIWIVPEPTAPWGEVPKLDCSTGCWVLQFGWKPRHWQSERVVRRAVLSALRWLCSVAVEPWLTPAHRAPVTSHCLVYIWLTWHHN